VGTLLLTLAGVIVVALLIFAVVAFTLGRATGLDPTERDAAERGLPADRPSTAEDISALSFDTGLRGYRMSQVDAVLERLAHELAARDEEISALNGKLAEHSKAPPVRPSTDV
jgi:DivIVA domain-containing protein